MLRRLPLLLAHGGAIHPHVTLATAMRALGAATATIDADWTGPVLRVGARRIAIDDDGYATLRFDGDASLVRSISAVDVLAGRFDPEAVRGRIVFIGSSAVGLNDHHTTAVDPRFAGLKVQAVAVENMLAGSAIARPSWGPTVALGACLIVGALMSAMFVVTAGVYAPMVGSAFLVVALALLSVAGFARAGVYVSPGAPMLVVATLFVAFFVTRFAMEKRRAASWRRQLDNARQVTIESMASVAETRDPETGAHIKRTQHYVKAIALELKRRGLHAATLTSEYVDLLFMSAPLHDIGKVGVPDHILLKPGKLTDDEMVLMRRHAEYGREIIEGSAERIEGDNFLVVAGEIAATHHEKWDGTGYPLGLAGERIPLSGRIMAVADIYDALISRRCYKEPFPHESAVAFMRALSGATFDPAVLDAFFGIEEEICAIAAMYRDEAEGVPPAEVLAPLVAGLAPG